MIPYDELCASLAQWRSRNGLVNGPSATPRMTAAVAAPAYVPPAPPPRAQTPPPPPARAQTPPPPPAPARAKSEPPPAPLRASSEPPREAPPGYVARAPQPAQSGEFGAVPFVLPASGGPEESTGMSREVNMDDEPPSLFDDPPPPMPISPAGLAPAGGHKEAVDSTTEIDIDTDDVVDEEESR